MEIRYPKDKNESLELQDALEDNAKMREDKRKLGEQLKHEIELSNMANEIRNLAFNATISENQFSAILEDIHSKETNRYSADEDNRYDFGTIVHRAIIGS